MLYQPTAQNRACFSILLFCLGFLLPAQVSIGGEAPENPKSHSLDAYLQELGYGSIPLKRTDQNHLAVDGEIAGKQAIFMIDTGNSITRLDKKSGNRFKTLAERGVRLEDTILGEFSGTNFVLVDELKLGNARFPNQPASVTTLAHVGTVGYEDCLIGCDFLLRHHCLIDCADLKFYVRADKPSSEMRNALETTLHRSGYHETVLTPTRAFVESCPVSVNGIALKLLVDSGSNFTYLDDHPGQQSPLAKLRVSDTGGHSLGIGKRGGARVYAATPESFQIDGIEVPLKNIHLGVTDLISFEVGRYGSQMLNLDGILGADILALTHGLVDLENHRLWFVVHKNRPAGKPQSPVSR